MNLPIRTETDHGPTRPTARLSRGPIALLGVAAVALVAAACSSTPSSSGSNTTQASNSAGNTGSGSTSSDTVKTATSSKGTILVNSAGMTLYTFGGNNGGTVNKCTGSCLAAWPALTVPPGTTPKGGPGVTGLGVAHQSDGSDQVTYNGQLLYTFTSDTGPGQVTGDGVANFSVAKVSSSSGSGGGSTSTSSSSGGGGGSGY